ncbi:MAG: guanylate cyclase [Roseiarcus sp.]
MSWSRQNSEARISDFRRTVPQTGIAVQDFANIEMQRRMDLAKLRAQAATEEDLIFNVKPNEAVVVNGAHVYVQLCDFGAALTEQDRETEASHSRALSMLSLHYAICDRVAAKFEAQRVDYHGGRMHAVIVSPSGAQNARERAQKAVAFGDAVIRAIDEAGRIAVNTPYRTRVRVGIDAGVSVAVNSGRASEPEPLFLGNPANYAAKLADGDQEGMYISDNVRRDLGQSLFGRGLSIEKAIAYNSRASNPYHVPDGDVSRSIADASVAPFLFHRHTPPLRTIDFKNLTPSKSIRMPLTSLFADIDGFTRYVAQCVDGGRITEMVSNLHVLRSEMAATLKEDFDGRKVRFIGDCLHGLIAEGTVAETDESKTVSRAVEVAGGLRSSFELCQDLLPNIGGLGLAIGIELGSTPITRMGIRGDRSVRCSISKAVSSSESLQRECDGHQTCLGPRAFAAAPAALKRLFDGEGKAHDLDYSAVAHHLASAPTIIRSGHSEMRAQPHCWK